MNSDKTVAQYLEELVRFGKYHFVVEEISDKLGIKKSSVSVSLSRLSKKDKVLMIRKGFGIITSGTSGPLDPSYFINAMMNHLDSKYYVGLLNAASYKGASHQAVMSYTVVADKVLRPVNLKGLTIKFVTKKYFEEINQIEKVAGVGGYFYISSPELTAIDLVRFPKKSGHLSNIATVLSELSEVIKINKLKQISEQSLTPVSSLQRLGYILDVILEEKKLASCIYEVVVKRKMQLIPLSVANKNQRNLEVEIDKKWNLKINTKVEPD